MIPKIKNKIDQEVNKKQRVGVADYHQTENWFGNWHYWSRSYCRRKRSANWTVLARKNRTVRFHDSCWHCLPIRCSSAVQIA
jgi:hypothetical protein